MRNAPGCAPESRRARRRSVRRRTRRTEWSGTSAVPRVGRPIGGDHALITLADREQLVLAHDVLAAILHVVLVQSRLDDGIDRAGFLTETAINALEQIDVVARGAPSAVSAHIRINGDG